MKESDHQARNVFINHPTYPPGPERPTPSLEVESPATGAPPVDKPAPDKRPSGLSQMTNMYQVPGEETKFYRENRWRHLDKDQQLRQTGQTNSIQENFKQTYSVGNFSEFPLMAAIIAKTRDTDDYEHGGADGPRRRAMTIFHDFSLNRQ